MDNGYRDKGGRILKGGKWRVFLYVVEVAVESPKSVDEAEAAEDSAEFIGSIGRTQGRVHESYVSIVKTWELENAPPSYQALADSSFETKPPKRKKLKKAKPVKAKKKKRTSRY
jgi:hypothetical protein